MTFCALFWPHTLPLNQSKYGVALALLSTFLVGKDLVKSRDLLLKQFPWTRQNTDWQNFKESRNVVKKMLLKAERRHTFEEVRLHKTNSSSLWKIINHAIPSKDKERPAYTKNLTVVSNEFILIFSKVGICKKKIASQVENFQPIRILAPPQMSYTV